MGKNWSRSVGILFVGIMALSPGGAMGDTYPSRPVSMIVPFPPGGATDLTARPIAAALEPILKQPVAVVNKPGAGGVVGMQFGAISKPDGYTVLCALATISVMPEVDRLFGRPKTYTKDDFVPIALLNADTTVLVVLKDAPWNSVAELAADAKKRPSQIKYSSAGAYSASSISHGHVYPCGRNRIAAHPHPGRRAGLECAIGRARGRHGRVAEHGGRAVAGRNR